MTETSMFDHLQKVNDSQKRGFVDMTQNGLPAEYKNVDQIRKVYRDEQQNDGSIALKLFFGSGLRDLVTSVVWLLGGGVVLAVQATALHSVLQASTAHAIWDRKTAKTVEAVMSSEQAYSKDDTQVAQMMLVGALSGVFPTTLDMAILCVVYGVSAVTVARARVAHGPTTTMHTLLAAKDVLVAVFWVFGAHRRDWSFDASFSAWGFAFLRTTLGVPFVIVSMNLFLTRLNYFKLAVLSRPMTFDYVYGMLVRLNTAIANRTNIYAASAEFLSPIALILLCLLGVQHGLMVVNNAAGVLVAAFAFLCVAPVQYCAWFVAWAHTAAAKRLQYEVVSHSHNHYVLTQCASRGDIVRAETRHCAAATKCLKNVVVGILMIPWFQYALFRIYVLTVGSVWLSGAKFFAIVRFLYASPFQFTLNLLAPDNTESALMCVLFALAPL